VGAGTRAGSGRALSLGLAAVIVLGACLRFGTLGVQHFWPDEAVTAGLLRLDLGDLLTAMSTTESTPPLYYVLARAWSVAFGTGEVGLRSLSALFGTLTIPVAYAIGAELASRRAGLAAAALTAASPALVWYSQEARSYALVILLGALSLLFVARASRREGGREPAWWAVTALLALLTHYFAVFLVVGEAIWLLATQRRRRSAAAAVAAVAAGGAALLPLAVHQSRQGNLDFIGETPLGTRLVYSAEEFLAGPTAERLEPAAVLAAVAVLAALVLAAAAGGSVRRTALLLVALALAGIAAPVALDLAGLDYLLGRNLMPLWIPLAVAVALGIATTGRRRLGIGAGIALVAASVWLALTVPFDRDRQREAMTAGLVGERLDAGEQRIDTRVGYAVAEAGESARVAVRCDAGYSVRSGGGTVQSGGDRATADSGRVARGWSASARSPAERAILSVYAICVRPLD
jgi:mannosyltransferase